MAMAKRRADARTTRGFRRRPLEAREQRARYLIVCEGTKTEPQYFASFHVNAQVKPVGRGPLAVVDAAMRLRNEEDYRDPLFDHVWCVFDGDDVPADDFNTAIAVARKAGMNVAYSNEAFELWYLLHFQYVDTGISRHDYITKLSQLLGHPYRKNNSDVVRELENRQPSAIAHARRLLAQYASPNPASDNPSTTVHLLIEALNRSLV
jgi:hypothetical protein